MLVACISVNHFPWRMEVQRQPGLSKTPCFVVQHIGSSSVLLDHSPHLKGITAGMPLQEALSECKAATLIEADPAFYQGAFEKLLDALETRSPVVESPALGIAYVALDGLAEMYGGEARLVTALLSAIPQSLGPRIGVGSGKFPAYIASLKAMPNGAVAITGDVAAFLAEVPVAHLPVSWKTQTQLRNFGLHTLADIMKLPVGPLQAQFGPEGKRIWELSRGQDPSPLLPRIHEETFSESMGFETPVIEQEAILTATEALLARLFHLSAMRGRFARCCTVSGQVLRGSLWQHRVSFREPAGNKDYALFSLKNALINHPPPGPLEDLALTLSGITGDTSRQVNMFVDVRRRDQLRDTISQLEARLGKKPPIYQVREMEPWSRIPERRRVLIPYAP